MRSPELDPIEASQLWAMSRLITAIAAPRRRPSGEPTVLVMRTTGLFDWDFSIGMYSKWRAWPGGIAGTVMHY